MVKIPPPQKFRKLVAVAVLLMVIGVSCQPAEANPTPIPVLQTVEVTRQVTQEVTRQVTQQVTQIVEVPVPVTVTPTLTPDISLTPSLTSTITRTPTITSTPDPPVVTILTHAACWYGPGDSYLYKYGLNATSWMEVIGRNLDGTYLFIQGVHGWNPCWVKTENVRFNDGGDVTTHDIRIVSSYAAFPFAMQLYRPPTGVQAIRDGSKVTIYWAAVWMTEDDYEGYLIEAYLCHAGQQVFIPYKWKPALKDNIGLQGMVVTDEPGCLVPSSARIYTAEKHGYTGYVTIPWPPYDTTAGSSPTPTP